MKITLSIFIFIFITFQNLNSQEIAYINESGAASSNALAYGYGDESERKYLVVWNTSNPYDFLDEGNYWGVGGQYQFRVLEDNDLPVDVYIHTYAGVNLSVLDDGFNILTRIQPSVTKSFDVGSDITIRPFFGVGLDYYRFKIFDITFDDSGSVTRLGVDVNIDDKYRFHISRLNRPNNVSGTLVSFGLFL